MRRFLLAALMGLSTLATGCASFVAPDYSADFPAVDALKRAGLERASVGKFEPQDPTAKVNRITLRGAPLTASNGTFSAYIERALIADLSEAGLYDPKSDRRIDLVLLKNDIDVSGINEGTGQIEANLTVSEAGTPRLRKTYSATTRFESSFAGAVAVPKGQAEYPNLVRALLSKIYRDVAFIQALGR